MAKLSDALYTLLGAVAVTAVGAGVVAGFQALPLHRGIHDGPGPMI